MIRRHKAFADIPAFYTDPDTGFLVANDRGEAATDADVDRFFRAAEPELDRLTLEMCALQRGRGETLEPWQHDAEMLSMRRIRDADLIRACESVLEAGVKLAPEYRQRYGKALVRRFIADKTKKNPAAFSENPAAFSHNPEESREGVA